VAGRATSDPLKVRSLPIRSSRSAADRLRRSGVCCNRRGRVARRARERACA
jgi:hypothetical protein